MQRVIFFSENNVGMFKKDCSSKTPQAENLLSLFEENQKSIESRKRRDH